MNGPSIPPQNIPPNLDEKPNELRFWHGFIGLLYLLGMGAFFLLLMGVAASFGVNMMSIPVVVIQTLVICIIIGVSALMVLFRLELPIRQTFWLESFPIIKTVVALVGVVAFGILADQSTFLLHQYKPELFSTEHLETFALLFRDASLLGFVALVLVVAVGPAIGEELMFRGLVFQSFRRDMSVPLAMIYSSILFGVIHFNWLQGVGAGMLGLYLAYVTWMSRSIVPAMAAHFFNNLLSCLFSRYDNEGVGQAYQKGHDGTVLIGAAIAVVLVVVFFAKQRRGEVSSL